MLVLLFPPSFFIIRRQFQCVPMSLNPKIIAVIAIAAVACIAVAAFVFMNQSGNNDGLEGNWVEYSVNGEKDAGMESYTSSGEVRISYLYHSEKQKVYSAGESGSIIINYTELQKRIPVPIVRFIEMPDLDSMEKTGKETISTTVGDKECDVYKQTVSPEETRTYWVADGWVPYKIAKHIAKGDVQSGSVEDTVYLYKNKGHTEVDVNCDLVVVEGNGITVSGNKESYKVGDMVKLTAEGDGKAVFSGWYDEDMKFISSDSTLEFEITRDTKIYARNYSIWDKTANSGDEIDLKDTFNVHPDYFYIEDFYGKSAERSEGKHTFTSGGLYVITAYVDDTPTKIYWMYVFGSTNRVFEWNYDGNHYKITASINFDDYQYAKNYYTPEERQCDRPDHVRDKTFVTLSYTDERMKPYMDKLADTLIDLYEKAYGSVDEYGFLDFLLSFTQNIEYEEDEKYTGYVEYWKFPLETLFDQGGDCEDTSILFLALAHVCKEKLGMDYRMALMIMPTHASAGVMLSTSTEYEANPDGFIFGETTATGYDLGDIPDKVEDYFLDAQYYPSPTTTVEIV